MNIVINETLRQLLPSMQKKYYKDEKTAKKSLVSLLMLFIGTKILNKFFGTK